ncbi:hypothetical protein NKH77_09000 [Streptomyces sp. M19]
MTGCRPGVGEHRLQRLVVGRPGQQRPQTEPRAQGVQLLRVRGGRFRVRRTRAAQAGVGDAGHPDRPGVRREPVGEGPEVVTAAPGKHGEGVEGTAGRRCRTTS